MNILILHRIPYHKVNYHLSIDHDIHQVTYIGLTNNLTNLPTHIRYQSIERPGVGNIADEILAAIHSRKLAVDLVISLSESELAEAAKVREALGVPGAGLSEIHKMRDRRVLKQLIAQTGIRVRQTVPLNRFAFAMKLPWAGKTVLKPIDADAGNGVKIYDCPSAILADLKQKTTGLAQLDQDPLRLDQFEVEEYIDGDFLHFDGLVKDGRIIVMQSSQYVGNCLLYALGQPLGSVQIETAPLDIRWTQKIIDAAGIRQGAFHLELISLGSSRIFLDIANRAGGASVVETFRMATGLNLIAAELSLLLGEDIVVKIRKKSKRFGWFMFPGHHLEQGSCQISGHAPYMEHHLMLRYEILGKTCPIPREVTYQPGIVPMSGIIGGASSIEMGKWLAKMFQEVKIKSVSKTAGTNRSGPA